MNKDQVLSKRDFNSFSIRFKDLPKLDRTILYEAWNDNPDVCTDRNFEANETVGFDWYQTMFDWIAEHPEEYKKLKEELKNE